jgi:hypothetical protein
VDHHSHQEVQCQCQQSGILIFGAVTGHKKQEHNNNEISCVKVFGEKPFKKSGNTGAFLFWMR